MSLSEQIRSTLRAGESMTLEQLADANSWSDEVRLQASKNLYGMRNRGEVKFAIEDGKRCYSIVPGFVPTRASPGTKAQKTKTKAPASETTPAKAGKTPRGTVAKRDFLAAAEGEDKVRKALEFAARVSDDAFEVYVAGVVNHSIYGPLKQARDQSREALHAFNSRLSD